MSKAEIRKYLDKLLDTMDVADLAIMWSYADRYMDGFEDHESTRIEDD